MVILAAALAGNGHTHADGQPMAQRAGADFNTMHLPGGMAGQGGVELGVGFQLILRKKAQVRQDGIVAFHAVPLAEDKAGRGCRSTL